MAGADLRPRALCAAPDRLRPAPRARRRPCSLGARRAYACSLRAPPTRRVALARTTRGCRPPDRRLPRLPCALLRRRGAPRAAAFAVALWTGAGLVGDAALVVLLPFVDGTTYLRLSAGAALGVDPAFLVVGGESEKLALVAVLGLLNSGWYAIPKAGLYRSLGGRSGAAVAVGGVGGIVGASAPLVLGFVASAVGLAATMWILLLAPLALVVASPRGR